MTTPSKIETAAAASVAKKAAGPRTWNGTVTDYDVDTNTAELVLDGDEAAIQALVAAEFQPNVGGRVLVLLAPPSTAFVLGTLTTTDLTFRGTIEDSLIINSIINRGTLNWYTLETQETEHGYLRLGQINDGQPSEQYFLDLKAPTMNEAAAFGSAGILRLWGQSLDGTSTKKAELSVGGSYLTLGATGIALRSDSALDLASASGSNIELLVGNTVAMRLADSGAVDMVLAGGVTPDVLFYDSTTKRITFGAAPSSTGTVVIQQLGAVAVAVGLKRYYPTITRTWTRIFAVLDVVGTTATTVRLLKNGTSVGTVTVAANQFKSPGLTISVPFTGPETDYMQGEVTVAGTGASGVSLQVS